MEHFNVRSLLAAGVICLLSVATTIAYRTFDIRRRMIKLRKMGLSFAPHHPVLGSLVAVKEVMADLPPDVNPQYIPIAIRRRYPYLGNVFYFDNWPFIAPILVAASPSTARQITQEHSLPKFPPVKNFFRPIAGRYDLVSMEGPLWKKWRGVFNPGFSAAYLTTLIPDIIEEGLVFCEILRERAAMGTIFQLKPLTDNFTVDVIGKLVLNVNLHTQRTPHPMITALRRQVQWLSLGTELNLWERWHPVRPFMHWYNSRIMNKYMIRIFNERLDSYAQQPDYKSNRCILDRSIQTYMSDVSGNSSPSQKTSSMDAASKELIVGQMKLFLFSGHDTTSASVCYSLYLLSKSSKDLERIRAEHDEVFGTCLDRISAIIAEDPHILNRLPFTLAVIKETLRLFPVVSSTRLGEPGFSVVAEDERVYPTEECLVWSSPHTIQHSPDLWPSPDDFLPDRWLVEPGHELYPVKGAWRPFEFGPRNCIGQELAVLEMKSALVLAIRQFDFNMPYAEWDQLHPKKGPKHVAGERAYQALNGGPSEEMPCRVKLRDIPTTS